MLEEPEHPPVIDRVEEFVDVQIQYPVHLPSQQAHRQGIERIMLPAVLTKPRRKAPEVHLVDPGENLPDRLLDHLVFNTEHAKPPFAPVLLRDHHTARGRRAIPCLMNALMQRPQALFESLPVVPPSHAVGSRRRAPIKSEEALFQQRRRQVRHQVGEHEGRISPRRFAHSRKSGRSGTPALRPATDVLAAVPLGQGPSLRRLRRRINRFVRLLHQYYASVRLPGGSTDDSGAVDAFVPRPCAPTRARRPSGISQVPVTELLRMLGFFDPARYDLR